MIWGYLTCDKVKLAARLNFVKKRQIDLLPISWEVPNILGVSGVGKRRSPAWPKIIKPFVAAGFSPIPSPIILFLACRLAIQAYKTKIMSETITKTSFQKEVMESGNLSLVQFRTEWSGSCQIIEPVFEDLARAYAGIAQFFSIDVEQEHGIEKEFGILELPTILFFRYGELIDHTIGLIPKHTLISKIENALH